MLNENKHKHKHKQQHCLRGKGAGRNIMARIVARGVSYRGMPGRLEFTLNFF